MASDGSVFFREHHCEDARRDRRIGGIRRHQLHFSVVVIDFPEAADIAVLDETEVVLAMRVVVFVEVIERANLARIKRRESEGRDSKPAVTTTVPPTNERRKASLSARIRSREGAFSVVIFNLKEFVPRGGRHARAPVADPRSRISCRSCSTRLLLL